MSHLSDLADEVTTALDAFAAGDLDAGYRAASKAHTLACELRRIETRLADQIPAAERDRVYAPEREA